MGLCYTVSTGESRFQYVNRDGQSKVLCLGLMPKRAAQHHETFLKKILASHLNPGIAIDKQTAAYLEDIPARLRKNLIKHGLIVPTAEEVRDLSLSFGTLIEKFLEFHREDNPNTYKNIQLACDKIIKRFGTDKKIIDVTATEINHFEKFLYREYAKATSSRLIKRFRQLMSWAIKNGFAKENIFLPMKVGRQENRERMEFVSATKVQTMMNACVNYELRLALYLARYMAFRIPSEAASWKWSYIGFENERIKVMDVKRGECRVLPLFEEMYPVLAELLSQKECASFLKDLQNANIDLQAALSDWKGQGRTVEELLRSKGSKYIAEMTSRFPKGEDYVFSPEFRTRKSRSNQMAKLKKKSGVTWQKDFQNLRVSRENEWIRQFDIHTATEWTGNSIEVAQRHYFLITPDIWDRATGAAEDKTAETLRVMLKTFGMEKVRAVLEGIAGENG